MIRLLFIAFVLVNCTDKQNESSKYKLSHEDVHFILKAVEIPVVDKNYIHLIKEEYLNDSSILIHIQQHGFDSRGNAFENELLFEGMKVFIYSDMLDYWVPDSYYKRFLVRYRKGSIVLDSLGEFSLKLSYEVYEQKPIEPILEEEDF